MDANPTMKIETEGYSRTKRAKGGVMKRNAGGHIAKKKEHEKKGGMEVHGKMGHKRPDKRARGGGLTSDDHPETTAGKMSAMPYEAKQAKGGSEGEGTDKD